MAELSTSTDEQVDTSVSSDNSTDDDDDVDLEDIEVSPGDVAGEDDEEQSDEPETTDEADEEVAPEEQSDDATEEEAELSEEDKQAAFNKEMYERRQNEKQQRLVGQQEKQQEYLNQAQDEQDLALRQLQIDAYDNKVDRNSNSLTNSYERAMKDFDVLRNASPEIQAELDEAIDSFQAQHVSVDAYGNPTEVRADFYIFLQNKANSITKLTGIRASNQEKNKAREKSKALVTPGRAPKEAKVDPDMAAFDEEADL